MNAPIPLLAAHGLAKSFGGVQAVRDVDFAVMPGEVYGLVGENGAGKTTLTRMLSGVTSPDSGTLYWQGEEVRLPDPQAAQALGIQTIHQELELLPPLSVAENVFLGALPSRHGLVDRRTLFRRTREILDELGADIDPSTPVKDLHVGARQIVEIAKALVRNAKVIFMDEPTAALPPMEAQRLLAVVRKLRDRGVGIVYISHKIDEILEISDQIVVMRDGRRVTAFRRGEADRDHLVEAILGHELKNLARKAPARIGQEVVNVRGLEVANTVEGADFEVLKGEVVGLFGLLGAGQSALIEALFGARPAEVRSVALLGRTSLPKSPADAIKAGIGYVPNDRKGAGLALNLSIWENLALTDLRRVSRHGILRRSLVRSHTDSVVRRMDIRCASIDQNVGDLSGGNQQKVVLGKWGGEGIVLLLLDEPTRGVDVGAKAEIYRLLREFAAGGGTCVVASSDAEEIATVCDRAYAMKRGHIVSEVGRETLSSASLLECVL
jgi:ABC-type sugar transport system ATPase subunit